MKPYVIIWKKPGIRLSRVNAIHFVWEKNIMPEARIVAVCSSAKRGVPKKRIYSGLLKAGYGLVGDAHGGRGDKEVSILLSQFLTPVIRKLGTEPKPGSFAENLLVWGLDEKSLAAGSVLRVGEAVIVVETVGKNPSEKHTYSFQGFSLLAEKGLFCRIIKSGWIKDGDHITIIQETINKGLQ